MVASQPYVLRLFGYKQALFLAVYRHAGSCIQDAFQAAADPALGPAIRRRMTDIYHLVRDLTDATPARCADLRAVHRRSSPAQRRSRAGTR